MIRNIKLQEVTLGEWDPDFKPEGFNEMTDMRKLNDCELSRNLEIKFKG